MVRNTATQFRKVFSLPRARKSILVAGTLYPLLHRLEADKLIKSKWDDSTGRKRKWYDLTAKGRKRLRTQAFAWQQYADCMRALVERFASPEVFKPG